MSVKWTVGIIIAIIVIFILYLSSYSVREGQGALVLRLGELEKNSKTGQVEVFGPGFHFKAPFITTVSFFDLRLQNLDGESSRIPTEEQKYLLVDYYAKWRIANLPLYYTRTGGYSERAVILLKQKINDALRAAFGERTLAEVVSGQRLDIMNLLKQKANQSAEGLGIQVVDVRIKGIDLPQQVQDSVYKRMSTQREQVATKYRYEGRAAATEIRAAADAGAQIMVAQAKTQAQEIRAAGDAEAAGIYLKAYNQNPQFYTLYRSLEAYRQVFKNKNTVMILKPTSEFFKYFNNTSALSRKAQ